MGSGAFSRATRHGSIISCQEYIELMLPIPCIISSTVLMRVCGYSTQRENGVRSLFFSKEWGQYYPEGATSTPVSQIVLDSLTPPAKQ